jgi:hypothetical protein
MRSNSSNFQRGQCVIHSVLSPYLRNLGLLGLGLVGLASASGCSRAANTRAAVSGTVRIDGDLLKEGAIAFFPIEGTKGPSSGGTIVAGKYDIPRDKGPTVGKNRVEIRAFRPSGKKVPDIWKPGEQMDEMVMALGPEYNDHSTLVKDIVQGQNQADFDLHAVSTARQ